ncbi:MAG: hypothetical protein QME66_12015 [Candidatus Eisenbacteria bacterium]|nr:hypothetical protein [Candidatus Eisenbacteria bacterium]
MLRLAATASLVFSVVFLSMEILKTFSFGKKRLYAEPRADGRKGVLFAFGLGMMPWEKESASKHLPTYTGGIVYHAGIFAGFFCLLSVIVPFGLPQPLVAVFRILFVLSLLSGLALLARRIIAPALKAISCPDDFASNILVDLFLLSAFLNTLSAGVSALFLILSIVMLLYIPFGKIRHCFFFFYVKVLFGLFFGRRGVLPPETRGLKHG